MAATLDAVTLAAGRVDETARPGLVDLDVRMHDVYAQHHDRLVGYFFRRTNDRPLAEDLAHDTIVRFADAADRFDWGRPVWPYLKAMASNRLIDHNRRDDREVIVDMETDPEWVERSDPGQDMDDTVVLGSLLEEAIDRLSDRQRVAVELRCRRGWSVADAADFLGIAEGAFNQLLFRARENLRDRLDRVGARAHGLALPAFVGLRLRLREAFDRVRDAVPTPSIAVGAEGLASMVVATTIGVAVAVGAPASGAEGKVASSLPAASTDTVSDDVAVSTAPAPDAGGVAVEAAPPVTPSTADAPATAPEAAPPAGRTTVVEAPDAVPDSDGRVTMGEDENEDRFVVTREAEAVVGTNEIEGSGDDVWVDCSELVRDVICNS